MSSILHRENARVYVKQIVQGESRARAVPRGAAGRRVRVRWRAAGANGD